MGIGLSPQSRDIVLPLWGRRGLHQGDEEQ
jgi:hypothetical protein